MDGEDACGMVSSFLHIGSFLYRSLGVYQTIENGSSKGYHCRSLPSLRACRPLHAVSRYGLVSY